MTQDAVLLQAMSRVDRPRLRARPLPINTFRELKKLRPMRQIEVAETMIAMNKFSWPYAQSLVAATPQHQLVSEQRKSIRGLSDEQRERIRERWQQFQELPPEDQQRIRENFQRFRDLPPERRQELRRRWQELSPEQRQQLRERFRDQRQRRPPPPPGR